VELQEDKAIVVASLHAPRAKDSFLPLYSPLVSVESTAFVEIKGHVISVELPRGDWSSKTSDDMTSRATPCFDLNS
jgi:hypothetical protein